MSLVHVQGRRSIEGPAPVAVLGGAPCASDEQGTLECTRVVWQGSTAPAWRTYQQAPLATTGTMQTPHASHNNASNSSQKHSHCGSVRAPMRVGPRDGCQASSLDAPPSSLSLSKRRCGIVTRAASSARKFHRNVAPILTLTLTPRYLGSTMRSGNDSRYRIGSR